MESNKIIHFSKVKCNARNANKKKIQIQIYLAQYYKNAKEKHSVQYLAASVTLQIHKITKKSKYLNKKQQTNQQTLRHVCVFSPPMFRGNKNEHTAHQQQQKQKVHRQLFYHCKTGSTTNTTAAAAAGDNNNSGSHNQQTKQKQLKFMMINDHRPTSLRFVTMMCFKSRFLTTYTHAFMHA